MGEWIYQAISTLAEPTMRYYGVAAKHTVITLVA